MEKTQVQNIIMWNSQIKSWSKENLVQIVSSKSDNQITENSSEATEKIIILCPFWCNDSGIRHISKKHRLMKITGLYMIKLDWSLQRL